MPHTDPSAPDDLVPGATPKPFVRTVLRPACGTLKPSALYARAKHWIANRYRPELHYMRGPGPKTLAKRGTAERH